MGTEQAQDNRVFSYILLASIIGVIALAGYAGYVLYPRFDLPAVTGLGLLALAAAAGIASFFSPCSFPLLVTLLARATGAEAATRAARTRRALTFGTALAVGASVFLILAGIIIAFGGAPLFEGVVFTSLAGILIRYVAGTALILLGLIQLGLLPISFRWADRFAQQLMRKQAQVRREQPVLGFAFLGFGYLIAGFG
jgi:cytochrome c biogenesis protein CcdA